MMDIRKKEKVFRSICESGLKSWTMLSGLCGESNLLAAAHGRSEAFSIKEILYFLVRNLCISVI